jgi:hypothetical protein
MSAKEILPIARWQQQAFDRAGSHWILFAVG